MQVVALFVIVLRLKRVRPDLARAAAKIEE